MHSIRLLINLRNCCYCWKNQKHVLLLLLHFLTNECAGRAQRTLIYYACPNIIFSQFQPPPSCSSCIRNVIAAHSRASQSANVVHSRPQLGSQTKWDFDFAFAAWCPLCGAHNDAENWISSAVLFVLMVLKSQSPRRFADRSAGLELNITVWFRRT